MNFTVNPLIPELSVLDLHKSLVFYVEILGFTIVYQREEEGFAFLALDQAQLMLDEMGKGRTWQTGAFDYPLGRGLNLQILVKLIQPIVDKLKHHNIELFLDVEEKWYRKESSEIGHRQFLVKDPDGYLLRFTEDLGVRYKRGLL